MKVFAIIALLMLAVGCGSKSKLTEIEVFARPLVPAPASPDAQTINKSPSYQARLKGEHLSSTQKMILAALDQVGITTAYDPAYAKLAYPNGDVPLETGVCADVIVRAFRKIELDLQKALHEDMKANFTKYPKKWGLKAPDRNIDHRRVPNLMTWFERQSKAVNLSTNAEDYLPGDVVAWDLGGGLTHIGLVSDIKPDKNFLIVHNIGAGTQIEDRLFDWKVIGHYRYFPLQSESPAPTPPRSATKNPKI